MGNAKVIFGNETLIDLTGDTVSANNLLSGATAHDRSGTAIQGAVTVPSVLDDLTDVDITTPSDGDLLQYNGTSGEWENNSEIPNAVSALEETGAVNKFNNTAQSSTINGVTWTVNADRTVTANGTASADSFFDVSVNGKIATGAYRLTACPPGGSDNTYGASVRYATGSPWWSGNDTGDGAVLDVKALDYIRLYVSAGVTVSNVLFKPMISDARLNLHYEDYQPYAMTNRELTTQLFKDITDQFNMNDSGTYPVGVCHFAMYFPLMKVVLCKIQAGNNTTAAFAQVQIGSVATAYKPAAQGAGCQCGNVNDDANAGDMLRVKTDGTITLQAYTTRNSFLADFIVMYQTA